MNEPSKSSPQRVLTRFDCVCIIVGTIIGAGIFKIPAIVASNVPNVYWLAGVWIFGGVIALIGALCFAELTTTYPDRGGDYGYLKRAYHPRVGFAFSWTAFWIIRPGNIGAMAMILGKYADKAFPELLSPLTAMIFSESKGESITKIVGMTAESLPPLIFAVLGVVTITITNLLGVKVGKTAQNILTVAKVIGILLIVVAAFVFGSQKVEPAANSKIQTSDVQTSDVQTSEATLQSVGSIQANGSTETADETKSSLKEGWFWLALMFVMFTFGGWNDIAFMTTEVKEPKKDLLPSLVVGTGVVLLVYLLVNFAVMYGFGFERMAAEGSRFQSATAAMVSENMGDVGNRIFASLVCVSCLGAINAMILTSPRIYWATALDYPALEWLAGVGQNQGWWRAMMLQGVVTLLLILTFGGRSDGFENIVAATAPYFWLFLALTIVSLVVNRIRYKGMYGGYRIPLGPVLPAIFVFVCVFMTWKALGYMVEKELQTPTAMIGGWVVVGAVLSFFLKTSGKHAESLP